MKKIILLLLLVLVSVTASARKSYVTLYAHTYSCYDKGAYLTGSVPSNIASIAQYSDRYYYVSYRSVGEILNLLSESGYEVESMTDMTVGNYCCVMFLLSKEIPSNQTQSEGDLNKDGEVNISDINRLVGIILGYVREHPEVLNQVELLKP